MRKLNMTAGREIANGFSELNDSEDQAERFLAEAVAEADETARAETAWAEARARWAEAETLRELAAS